MLIVIAGLPGSGKSALATALGHRLGVPVLSVDTIENAMLQAGLTPGWDVGVAAYEVAGAVARQHLTSGRSVIVDAVSDSEASRETWRVAAADGPAELKIVEVRCGDELEHRQRLSERRRGLAPIAEPTWADVERRAAAYAPWRQERLTVDTAEALDTVVEQVLTYLQADDVQLNYPEVGATAGPLRLPAGYALVRRTAGLGHGRQAFDTAAEHLMRWDMHRRAGLRVESAAERAVLGGDVRLVLSVGPLRFPAPCRVVRVVDEPRARGFAYGTLTGHPEMGEESFVVRLDEQDRVTLEIVAFSRPARWWSRLAAPVSRLVQRRVTERYLSALASG